MSATFRSLSLEFNLQVASGSKQNIELCIILEDKLKRELQTPDTLKGVLPTPNALKHALRLSQSLEPKALNLPLREI